MPPNLKGKVAVVTGASRGIGRGIALGLGEAGATVYITGRTVEPGKHLLAGTVGETARQVTEQGGHGVAVACDHADDAQVADLFKRVEEEQGKLDLLVNNAFATPEPGMPLNTPFWELPIEIWDRLHTVGLRSAYTASVFAMSLFLRQGSGLIVNISSRGAARYVFNVPYGVAKAGLDRLTADLDHDSRDKGVAVVSLWPGLTKTEGVLAGQFVADLSRAATPQFSGRAVAALAADPNIMLKSGKPWGIFELADEYGFTDIDGSKPVNTARARPRRGDDQGASGG